MPRWIWQHPRWPQFSWQAEVVAPLLRQVALAQGELLGRARGSDAELQATFSLDAMLQNLVNSSAIEGETLNVQSVRSSLARKLGLEAPAQREPNSDGLAEIMWDVVSNLDDPLTDHRLFTWHRLLFADDNSLLTRPELIGCLRGEAPMQVVSGRIDRPTIHFEAPPRATLEAELATFIDWFNRSRHDPALDPLLRAAIAHFWFVTLHPFDDGNGRLTRALTDLALAQGEPYSIRFYAMSVAILADRQGYYQILEQRQRGDDTAPDAVPDLTNWLVWFLTTLHAAIGKAQAQIDRVLGKSRFWLRYRDAGLSPEQIKVLNRLLDGGSTGFEHGISAAQYQAVAKVSKATATRHLADLLAKGCLVHLPGGGRSTRYQINWLLEPANQEHP